MRLCRGIDHPPQSSAKIKERLELYPYYPSGPSYPVLGRILHFYVTGSYSWRVCGLRLWAELGLFPSAFHSLRHTGHDVWTGFLSNPNRSGFIYQVKFKVRFWERVKFAKFSLSYPREGLLLRPSRADSRRSWWLRGDSVWEHFPYLFKVAVLSTRPKSRYSCK